jgi:preprotein translocase subunit SecA
MRTAKIPAPGIVLGAYPERHSSAQAGLMSVVARWLARRTDRAGGADGFLARVRGHEQARQRAPLQSLREHAHGLRARLARDGLEDRALVEEAFALVALACREHLAIELYDTQLIAARIMLDGDLAEMATGEGKTLAVAVAAGAAALAGIPVHVVTANDYLVERDSAALRPMYEALGLSVGAVTQPMDTAARRAAYARDIAYCTAKELVFDYLRDQVGAPRGGELEQRAFALSGERAPARLLRGLCMAVIDEADSILIDEARVPLVLSRPAPDPEGNRLRNAWRLSAILVTDEHFHLDREARRASLSESGRELLRSLAQREPDAWPSARHCEESVTLALAARHPLERDRDYVIHEGRVQIVDETSGRRAPGRSWSRGLHQLVEIKESCEQSPRAETLAQITYQRFFPRYLRLCGVSGTLRESAGELHGIYGLGVRKVPLRGPDHRRVLAGRVFSRPEARWSATVERVRELNATGRPVLIGTDSVLDSQALSRRLAAAALPHAVLNASQDADEARIVAGAGAAGAITVTTNMAGRGTDIVLSAATRAGGGLHVLYCQQNAARRIDRQLIGRCARQGDPGTAEYFVALTGPLLDEHWVARILGKWSPQGELGRGRAWLGMLALRIAQRSAESRHRSERKALMLQDRQVGDWLAFSGTE